MKLLLTTNGRLCKNRAGEYYTSVVYGYGFFARYFEVFDDIYLVAHCETLDEIPENYIRVDGKGLHILEVPFPHGKIQYIKKYFSIKRAIKKAVMSTDFDVAVLRVPDQLAFQVFNVLRKKKVPIGAEIISNSWDLFDTDISGNILRPFIRRIWDWNERKIVKKANGTAFVTKNSIQQRYTPNTLPLDHFTTNYSSANIDSTVENARKYTDTEKPKTLLHVAADIGGTVKGHKELMQAIAMLKKEGIIVNATIVGDGKLSAEVESIIKENDLSSQLRFTGRLQKDELKKEYKNADLFVFPSYREGLPRVVIEAMANALPCIATELDGIKELISADCLVPVKDSVTLKEKIKLFVSDNALLEAKSLENLENARDYTKEVLQKKRNDFFNELLSLVGKHEKRTKVFYLINTLGGGGAEKVLVDLVNTMDKSKYDVTVMTLLGGVNEQKLDNSIRYKKLIKTNSPILTKLLMLFYQKLLSYNTFHKLFIGNNYDIEIAYLQGFPARVIGAGESNAKKLTFVHGDCSKQWSTRSLYKDENECLEEYRRFTNVCFVSKVAMDGYEKAIGHLDNGIVLHNVLNVKEIKQLSNIPMEVPFTTDSVKMVTVGRLVKDKNFIGLVKACQELEKEYSFELQIIGEGEQREDLEKLIKDNNIKSVKLLGYKTNPYPYMKNADLYVCSSLYEGYSTSVTESVILGTPVLTTLCAGMDEILENGELGMIVENSYEGLKNGLISVLSDRTILNSYTQKVVEKSSKITNEELLKGYTDLFDSIL